MGSGLHARHSFTYINIHVGHCRKGDGRWLPAKLSYWTQTQKQAYRIHLLYIDLTLGQAQYLLNKIVYWLYFQIADTEVYIDGHEFKFYSKPYYLR